MVTSEGGRIAETLNFCGWTLVMMKWQDMSWIQRVPTMVKHSGLLDLTTLVIVRTSKKNENSGRWIMSTNSSILMMWRVQRFSSIPQAVLCYLDWGNSVSIFESYAGKIIILFFLLLLGRNGTESTITEATTGLLYQPRMMMMMMSVEK
jgi:hypothetical protein